MTTPRSALRARLAAPAAGAILALTGIATFGGCLVSFDGYQLGEPNAGASGEGTAGRASAGEAGDSSGAGSPSDGGASGSAGKPSSGGQSAAGAGTGGSPNGGSAGAATAGSGGVSGGGTAGASGGGAANAGAGGGPSTLHCAEPNGRISVEIPLPGGGFYCIDRAEVRNVDYQAFLTAAVSTAGQVAGCGFNTTFAPDTTGDCTQFDPVNKKNMPIACVDWCDAAAYCKWEGKRLCGKLGGGSNAPSAFADATKSEWYRACSNAGTQTLPYGSVYAGMKCITTENSAIRPVAVPYTDCEGGYSGLYDMSGNVSEWEDSCAASAGASDQCAYRGGSYLSTNKAVGGSPSALCNSNVANSPLIATKARSTRDKEIGFRCCSDPVP